MSFNLSWESLKSSLPADSIQEKKSYAPDTRFFKLQRDENDEGSALIRLLPSKTPTGIIPFVKLFSHNFNKFDPVLGKKRYFIEDSLQSIGLEDPVAQKWQELMSIGTTEAKEEAKILQRKIKFITNIQILKYPANPELEGKVMLWEFGTKLQDKFLKAISPSESDVALGTDPVNLYHPTEGANILLKIQKASGYFNYDATSIKPQSAICEEDEIEALLDKTHDLQEFLSPEHYLSYEELKVKMEKVLNAGKSPKSEVKAKETREPERQQEALIEEVKVKPKAKPPVEDDEDLDSLMAELEDM